MRICCAHIFGACLGKARFKSARNTLPKTISVKLHLGTEACPEHEKHQLWDRGPSGRPSATSSPSYEIRSNCHGSWLERADHHHLLRRFQAVVLSWTRGHNSICSKMEATSRKNIKTSQVFTKAQKSEVEQIKVMSHDFVSNKKNISFKISTTWGAAPITQELGASMDRGTTPAAASNNCAAPRVFCLPNQWIPCNTGYTRIVKVRLRHKICWKQDLSGVHHQNKKERTPECFVYTCENVSSEFSVEGFFSSNQARQLGCAS